MVKKRVMVTFPEEAVREPVIYNLGQQFKIAINIVSADISEDKGWAVLELQGEEDNIQEGLAWVTTKGVRVEEATHDFP